MSGVRVGITKKVGQAHGWERVVIVEEAFVELDHGLIDDLMIRRLQMLRLKSFTSTRRVEAGRLYALSRIVRGIGVYLMDPGPQSF